jgi:prolipoprotein diacylglyceryltransferase
MALTYSPLAPHGHFYYQLAQFLAFGLYVGLLLGQGYRRGYPWRQWLPLVAAATLALMLGCQLVFLPPAQWLAWLGGNAAVGQALAEGPRSVVGGAAASLLAVVALRRALGFRSWAVLDAFAGPLCWALVAQCVGCVLVGCCWGEVNTSGVLSFSYGPGTLPYLAQRAQGLLPAGAAHSLPVVPTQLFHLLLCAGTGLMLPALRRRTVRWPGGSRYLLAMGMLCLGRFGIEFWRDPAGEPLLAAPLALAGFSLLQVQWLLLLEGLALLGSWAWLVRRGQVATPVASGLGTSGAPTWVALGLLAATARLGSSLLSAPEVLTLQALLLLVLLAEAQAWLPFLYRGLPRLAGLPLAALLSGVLLLAMAQAPAPQQAAPAEPSKTMTFSGGILGSYHETEEEILADASGCSSSQPLVLQQRVRAVGGEVAVETITSRQYQPPFTNTWGGGVWVGEQQVAAQTLPTARYRFLAHDTTMRFALVDMHVYREMHWGQDWLSLGARVGVHVGPLGYYSYYDKGDSRGTTWLMPELMVSLGNPRLLYGQADLCYGPENALGAYTGRVSLGSGLGQVGGSQLLVGYARSPHQPTPDMVFASANLRLPAGTGLSALSLEPYFATDFARHNIFSMKLHYRLGSR